MGQWSFWVSQLLSALVKWFSFFAELGLRLADNFQMAVTGLRWFGGPGAMAQIKLGANIFPRRGIYFMFLFCFLLAFGFLAFRLLGFLASWLFLAFRILCFLSSSPGFGFLVFGFGFPHPQRHQFLPILIITSSNMMGGLLPLQSPRYFLDCLQKIKNCPYLNHHFFKHHGGGCRPPNLPATF